MPYLLTGKDEPVPDGYHAADLLRTIPGADWFIDGRRYRGIGRAPTVDGETIGLELADADERYGYVIEES